MARSYVLFAQEDANREVRRVMKQQTIIMIPVSFDCAGDGQPTDILLSLYGVISGNFPKLEANCT